MTMWKVKEDSSLGEVALIPIEEAKAMENCYEVLNEIGRRASALQGAFETEGPPNDPVGELNYVREVCKQAGTACMKLRQTRGEEY